MIYSVLFIFLFQYVRGNMLEEIWDPILEDQFLPWKNRSIDQQVIQDTLNNYGSHIIFQHLDNQILIHDPKGYCFCNKSAYGDSPHFQTHFRLCRSIASILNATIHYKLLPDFEIVVSLDDIPMWIINDIDITLPDYKSYPGFGSIRCWGKPTFAIPFMGSSEEWDIDTFESTLPFVVSDPKEKPSLESRRGQVVFRGGMSKGCSFERDTRVNFHYWTAFTYGQSECGRNLLYHKFNQSKWVDYHLDYQSYAQQEQTYRYVLCVEGFGGWADRLSYLLSGNMVVMNQNHPCDQWFEPLLIPQYHYIPVAHDFRDLEGKVIWANNHPHQIEQILHQARSFADTYLRRQGIISYMYSLLRRYTNRVTYRPIRRNNTYSITVLRNRKWLDSFCKE